MINAKISKEAIDAIIEERMPQFVAMCSGHLIGVKDIILTTQAFGDTQEEILLLGMATKYACDRGYTVTFAPWLKLEGKEDVKGKNLMTYDGDNIIVFENETK